MVVFECVGAAGLIQKIVDSVDIGTRIYCAGGWYSGDSLNITDATRQGVTIQFGGGPHPQDWYGTLDAIAAGSTGSAAQCRSGRRSRRGARRPRLGPKVHRPSANHRPPERRCEVSEREDRQDSRRCLGALCDRDRSPGLAVVPHGLHRRLRAGLRRGRFLEGRRRDHGVHAAGAFDGRTHHAPVDQSGDRGGRGQSPVADLRRRADHGGRHQLRCQCRRLLRRRAGPWRRRLAGRPPPIHPGAGGSGRADPA